MNGIPIWDLDIICYCTKNWPILTVTGCIHWNQSIFKQNVQFKLVMGPFKCRGKRGLKREDIELIKHFIEFKKLASWKSCLCCVSVVYKLKRDTQSVSTGSALGCGSLAVTSHKGPFVSNSSILEPTCFVHLFTIISFYCQLEPVTLGLVYVIKIMSRLNKKMYTRQLQIQVCICF